MQGKSHLQFMKEIIQVFRDFVDEQEFKHPSFRWEGFHIWCADCKRLKRYTIRFVGREDYVRIKRHGLYYPEHCIHCDPCGLIKP